MEFKAKAQSIFHELVGIRRELHQFPELSGQEIETAARVAARLEDLGLEVQKKVGGHGVVGILAGSAPGRVVALRCDMDALPVEEQNDVDYKSRVKGVMHACGHDVHMTCLLGAAILLQSVKEQIKGTVKFIFQPAEETNKGARAMLAEGVLDNPPVEAIYGLHNAPNLDVGQVGIKAGPLMAAVDSIKITVRGEGGHGAIPHQARDAVLAAAAVIQNIQTVVSRRVSPFDHVVVTIGTIKGGQASNIIADRVEMKGTVRTFSHKTRKEVAAALERIITDTCSALDTEADLAYKNSLPPLINEEECTRLGCAAAAKVVGKDNVILPEPSTGGEDFALFLEQIPGCFYFLGVRNETKGITRQWHHPSFDIDEEALSVGAAVLAQSALDFLHQ